MKALLPYYERELAFLRQRAQEFGARYPKIAARLLISGDSCEDPHVERMIESFALLSARVHKKLDDEFPEFTGAFLDVLYPHYLRPLPSCSIAHFDTSGKEAQMSGPTRVERGTLLSTRPTKGVSCKFRTSFELALTPIKITALEYRESFAPPRGYPTPVGAANLLSATLESLSEQIRLDAPRLDVLRLYIDGESTLVAQLREALLSQALGIALEIEGDPRWRPLGLDIVRPVGFAPEDALFDYDGRSHLAFRLLSEFFAFPEKFNFVDLDLRRLARELPTGARKLRLHFVLGSAQGARDPRLMERLSASNLRTHCTPVVNLFRQRAEPIRLTHTRSSYPVVPDARRPQAFEVYSVDRVTKVERAADGESICEYRPHYSLRHGATLEDGGRFWHLRRDEEVAELSPGFEYELSVVDVDFAPERGRTETLSVELTCTNRDLPSQLPFGLATGDLFLEGGGIAHRINLLRKPTPTTRVKASASQWRLISHLSLSQLPLGDAGLETLKETLTLYDATRTASTQRLIDGLCSIRHSVTTARVSANPFPSFARGIEITLGVDEHAFVGLGVEQFARVLDHFFGLFVHLNSFSRLVLVSHENGREILRCPPRNGSRTLL
ncbi:type VI secretion system baseplate subunit TssF [Niveibacterium sp. SC-1]|uniref:type VI secretion system baseplate subunit TssF n=1 Tax=Niveibacterium sp. SC-1 TaxID=3135646 RepID=UPI003120075C